MIDNKHEPDFNDDDIDLSDMINEYDEDDELRRRIQKMKEEKEHEEKRMASLKQAEYAEIQNTSAIQRPQHEETTRAFEQVSTEDALEQTRVINMDDVDVDKTLVIMNNKLQRSYDNDQESTYQYKNQNIDEEEIGDDDIEEFLNEEKPKPGKKPMDPNKMNKIITYIIVGVVSVCVLVAGFFGMKLLFDGSDAPKEEVKEPVKEDPKEDPVTPEPTPEKPSGGNNNNNPTTPPVDPTKNNQLESAKEQMKIEEANLKTLKAEQQAAQDNLDKNFTSEKRTGLETIRTQKAGLRDDIAKTLLTVNENVKKLTEEVKKDPTKQTDLDAATAEKATLDKLSTQYQNEYDEANRNLIKFDTDSEAAKATLDNAKDKVIDKQDAIRKLQEQIDSLS